MRSILFHIPLNAQIDLGPLGKVPVFGAGLLLAAWCLFVAVSMFFIVRQFGWKGISPGAIIVWIAGALAIHEAPRLMPVIPIYGYGTMLFVGFMTCAWVASARLRKRGFDGEIAWDVAMWVFISGIVGARTFYVIQYHEKFFVQGRGLMDILVALVSLPDGGLVFFGGMISGAIAYFVFCWKRGIDVLALSDILIPSVFIAMSFGRIGCLLNGCCYGDPSSLPWAVTFPPDSVPFVAEVQRGFLSPDARCSLPLHPTQAYSAITAAVLALFTWAWYPHRRRDGEVLALGWLLYPICRFMEEVLRGDELGQFNTPLTISQWVSLGLFGAGIVYALFISRTRAVRIPA